MQKKGTNIFKRGGKKNLLTGRFEAKTHNPPKLREYYVEVLSQMKIQISHMNYKLNLGDDTNTI